ncbi:MAG: hypothetical protein WC227_02685 [Patescibacteria group bacterium]|jgi:hypothetical protein
MPGPEGIPLDDLGLDLGDPMHLPGDVDFVDDKPISVDRSDLRLEATMAKAALHAKTEKGKRETSEAKRKEEVFKTIFGTIENIGIFRDADKDRRAQSYGKSWIGDFNRSLAGVKTKNSEGIYTGQTVGQEIETKAKKIALKTVVTIAIGAGIASIFGGVSIPIILVGAAGGAIVRGVNEARRIWNGKERNMRGEIEAANEAVIQEIDKLIGDAALKYMELEEAHLGEEGYQPDADPEFQAILYRAIDLAHDDTKRKVKVVKVPIGPDMTKTRKEYVVVDPSEEPPAAAETAAPAADGTTPAPEAAKDPKVFTVAEKEAELRKLEKKNESISDWCATIGSLGTSIVAKVFAGAKMAETAASQGANAIEAQLRAGEQVANIDLNGDNIKHTIELARDQATQKITDTVIFLKEAGKDLMGAAKDAPNYNPWVNDIINKAGEHWHTVSEAANDLTQVIDIIKHNLISAELHKQLVTVWATGAAGLLATLGNSWGREATQNLEKAQEEQSVEHGQVVAGMKKILPKPIPETSVEPVIETPPEEIITPAEKLKLAEAAGLVFTVTAEYYFERDGKGFDLDKGDRAVILDEDDLGTCKIAFYSADGEEKFPEKTFIFDAEEADLIFGAGWSEERRAERESSDDDGDPDAHVDQDETDQSEMDKTDAEFATEMHEKYKNTELELTLDEDGKVTKIGKDNWPKNRENSGVCENANTPNGRYKVKISNIESVKDSINVKFDLKEQELGAGFEGYTHAGFLKSDMSDGIPQTIIFGASANVREIVLLDKGGKKWKVQSAVGDDKLAIVDCNPDGTLGDKKHNPTVSQIKEVFIEWYHKEKPTVKPPEKKKPEALPTEFTDKFTESGKIDSDAFIDAIEADYFDRNINGGNGGRVVVDYGGGVASLFQKIGEDQYEVYDFDLEKSDIIAGQSPKPRNRGDIEVNQSNKVGKLWLEKSYFGTDSFKKNWATEKTLNELDVNSVVHLSDNITATVPKEPGAPSVGMAGLSFKISMVERQTGTLDQFTCEIVGNPDKVDKAFEGYVFLGGILDVKATINRKVMKRILEGDSLSFPLKLEKKKETVPAADVEKRLAELQVGEELPIGDSMKIEVEDGPTVFLKGLKYKITKLPFFDGRDRDQFSGHMVSENPENLEKINSEFSEYEFSAIENISFGITIPGIKKSLAGKEVIFSYTKDEVKKKVEKPATKDEETDPNAKEAKEKINQILELSTKLGALKTKVAKQIEASVDRLTKLNANPDRIKSLEIIGRKLDRVDPTKIDEKMTKAVKASRKKIDEYKAFPEGLIDSYKVKEIQSVRSKYFESLDEFVGIYNDFLGSLEHADTDEEKAEFISLSSELKAEIEKLGLVSVEAKTGDKCDYSTMEASEGSETGDEKYKGKEIVERVIKQGFIFDGSLQLHDGKLGDVAKAAQVTVYKYVEGGETPPVLENKAVIPIEKLQENVPAGFRLYGRAEFYQDDIAEALDSVDSEADEPVPTLKAKPLLYGDGDKFWIIIPEDGKFNRYSLDKDFNIVGEAEILTVDNFKPKKEIVALYRDKLTSEKADEDIRELVEGSVVPLGYNVRVEVGGGKYWTFSPSFSVRVTQIVPNSNESTPAGPIEFYNTEIMLVNEVQEEMAEFDEEANIYVNKYGNNVRLRFSPEQMRDVLIGNNVTLTEDNVIKGTPVAEEISKEAADNSDIKELAEVANDQNDAYANQRKKKKKNDTKPPGLEDKSKSAENDLGLNG